MAEQPTDPVIEAVRADLLRRQQHGYLKYGGTLATNPATHIEKLRHAYEEALDLCNYLKWSILSLEGAAVLQPDPTHNVGFTSRVRRCQGAPVREDGTCIACFASNGQACLSPAVG